MLPLNRLCIVILCSAVLFGVNARLALAQEHDHDHAHHEKASAHLSLNNGKKWESDANLRQGMSNIRDALNANLSAIHASKETGEQYQVLAKQIDTQIEFMMGNCKLEPKADAMLHQVLADIIAGTEAMRQPDTDRARKGAEDVAKALDSYGHYFVHPGWNRNQHHAH